MIELGISCAVLAAVLMTGRLVGGAIAHYLLIPIRDRLDDFHQENTR